jgi:hypothetical protein
MTGRAMMKGAALAALMTGASLWLAYLLSVLSVPFCGAFAGCLIGFLFLAHARDGDGD